jgi:hypothetical protein
MAPGLVRVRSGKPVWAVEEQVHCSKHTTIRNNRKAKHNQKRMRGMENGKWKMNNSK